MRLAGASYEEIARAGGGIVSTVGATRAASEDELVRQALRAARRADRRRRHDGRDQVRLWPRSRDRAQDAARRAAARRKRAASTVSTTFLGAHALPPEFASDARPMSTCVVDEMLPALAARRLWSTRSTASARRIAFSPDEIARVFDAARALGPAGQAARRAAFEPAAAPRSPPSSARFRPTISNMPTKPARRRWRSAGTVAVLLPGAFYILRETQAPPVALLREHGVPIAVATDCNPGTSPLTSLLLALNMAATLFRLTVDECLAGVTRNAARALGLASRDRFARGRQMGAISRSGTSSGRPSSSTASASIRCTRASGADDDDHARRRRRLARRLARRSSAARAVALDPACAPAASPPAPRRSQRILARGEPVYGVNTGFGKLASVRIATADLARLQRNIVLSHAAGVGEPTPVAATRLMMALKLASLAQGASGVRPETLALLEAMLAARRDARSCRRKARSAPRATSRRSRTWRRR